MRKHTLYFVEGVKVCTMYDVAIDPSKGDEVVLDHSGRWYEVESRLFNYSHTGDLWVEIHMKSKN